MSEPKVEDRATGVNPSASPGAVGLLGIGLVGTALAERLLAAEWQVRGHDILPERREVLRKLGGVPLDQPDLLHESASFLVLSLPDSRLVGAALARLSPDWPPGLIVIDTTTGDPDHAVEAGRRLADQGIRYLDATISGSSEQIREGEATLMVGGSREGFETARALLAVMGRKAVHLGEAGSGSRLKLVSNLILGLNRAALAEGLVLARSWGLDLPMALSVLKESAAYSRAMDAKGDKMIQEDFRPQARLAQHHKDVRLILEAARRLSLTLPLSETHDQLLTICEQAGCSDLDNSAIIKAYEVRGSGGAWTPSGQE